MPKSVITLEKGVVTQGRERGSGANESHYRCGLSYTTPTTPPIIGTKERLQSKKRKNADHHAYNQYVHTGVNSPTRSVFFFATLLTRTAANPVGKNIVSGY
ncbi:hypothetical protein, unlikely [Trypanosoma brucei gambiense DAL972]|uniref:Uncharacterized protein n=1 Tax=Trypanosoma brucei gambiense (strain MHOM/CI/86/DAL972) TaxID=679716 RepID=D0A1T4_TRYB9|nr:hypothetical protein, unlikely [Trypanosoma brucei gambiense DAL972]CBH15227.1 hypothetical protein, unlikely [Trypanosoma brucei gambiense DAL972]|eukprot:XP_011777492.1 hypothetical protein, unlikely [Trypanosoma brucei gambiense DAL972]